MEQQSNIYLGYGILSWNSYERVSDRYGSIILLDINDHNPPAYFKLDNLLPLIEQNAYGSLIANIIQVRDSRHIGDIFRGFSPTKPTIGEVITLGTGTLFTQMFSKQRAIGLRPLIVRESDWLDPKSLYRCHEQTVDIFFRHESVPLS